MAAIKQIPGYSGIALGAIGLLICLAVIVAAWWVNTPVTNALLFQVIPPIETALDFGETAVSEFNVHVGVARTQLAEAIDTESVATALEDEIRQIKPFVDVATSAAASSEQLVERLADSLSGLPLLAAERLLGALHEVTDTLASVETLTRQVGRGLNDQVSMLETQLETLHGQATEVEAAIVQVGDEVASAKEKIPLWIDLGSLLVTLAFLWFGTAQYTLMRACWHLVRQRRRTRSGRSDSISTLNRHVDRLQSQLSEFKKAVNRPPERPAEVKPERARDKR